MKSETLTLTELTWTPSIGHSCTDKFDTPAPDGQPELIPLVEGSLAREVFEATKCLIIRGCKSDPYLLGKSSHVQERGPIYLATV